MKVLSPDEEQKIDKIVIGIKKGDTITYGEIAEKIWGNRYYGKDVGVYLNSKTDGDDYPKHRVVSRGKRPPHSDERKDDERKDNG